MNEFDPYESAKISILRAAKAANSTATTNNKPTTRSAAKNKEDTSLSSPNQALTTKKRKSIPRAAKDKTALAKTNSNSNVAVGETNKRKSTTTSNTDGRSTQKRKSGRSVFGAAQYQSYLETGAAGMGIGRSVENRTLRALGCEKFKILRRLLDGTCKIYVTPFVLSLKRDSQGASKLLGEGKVPQVLPENLEPGELLQFNAFKLKETPGGAAESNFRSFATALEIKDLPNVNLKEQILKNQIFKRNGVLPSSRNPSWHGGQNHTREAAKQKEHVFFMKDCCDKRSVTFFGEEGRTLRWYYTREGNWNRQFIESLENDKKTNGLFKALLFEEGKKSINELVF